MRWHQSAFQGTRPRWKLLSQARGRGTGLLAASLQALRFCASVSPSGWMDRLMRRAHSPTPAPHVVSTGRRESPGKNRAQDSLLLRPLPRGRRADSLVPRTRLCPLQGQTLPTSGFPTGLRQASVCPSLGPLSVHLRNEGLCPKFLPALGFGGSFALFGASFLPVGTGKVLALESGWDLSPSPATCWPCHLSKPLTPVSFSLGGEM